MGILHDSQKEYSFAKKVVYLAQKKPPGMTIRSLPRKSRVFKSCHQLTIFPQIRKGSVFLANLQTYIFSLT